MKKLIVNAALPVDDNFDPDVLQRMLAAIGAPGTGQPPGALDYFASVTAIDFKDVGDLTERVWVYVSPDDEEPLYLVRESGDREDEGVALSDKEMDDILDQGVCVFSKAEYPRGDRYGVPVWASHDKVELAPAIDGFAVSKQFDCDYEDSGDDSCESFWHQIALPANHPLTQKLKD